MGVDCGARAAGRAEEEHVWEAPSGLPGARLLGHGLAGREGEEAPLGLALEIVPSGLA